MNIKESVGQRIKELSKEKGWKNYELANIVDVPPTHMKKYLDGIYDPIKFIDPLREHCTRKEINWLLTGERDKATEELHNQVVNEFLEKVKKLEDDKLFLLNENFELKREIEKLKKNG